MDTCVVENVLFQELSLLLELYITMSTIISVKQNVLMYLNIGKGCFSGKQPYSSHVRYNL